MKKRYLFGRFAPYYKKYVSVLLLDFGCATLTTLSDLFLPLMVRSITNSAIMAPLTLTVNMVLKFGAAYIAMRLIDVAANYYMANIGHVMGAKIETDMRRDIFSHLQDLSFSFYSDTKVGALMSRITSDLFDVSEFAHHCPEEYYIAAIKILVSFVILLRTDVWLTLIIFAILPVMIICSLHFSGKMRANSKETRVMQGEINAQIEDSLLGIRVVKSFANENIEKEKFSEGNEGYLRIKKQWYRTFAGFQSTTRLFDGIMYIVVVVAGALFIVGGRISAPEYMAYILYVSMLLTSVRRIVEFNEQLQRGVTGLERFFEIMDEEIAVKDKADAKSVDGLRGEIEFQDVSFSYGDTPDCVLTHLNLHIAAGENVALVGPSGAGKTTLCNLIPRFYDVAEGRILVDGEDVRDLMSASLRAQIGMVQQDVYLFSGSVFDNICYGKPEADSAAVIEAAKLAGAHDFISALPEGYSTYVGERGVKLSGGQKQRISIARVFLKNPPILILDEATSSLDSESEKLVQESLAKLSKGRTTLTIAHRLSTIRNAGRILVLTEHGIEEEGSHAQLLAKQGIYANLYSAYNA